MRRYETLETLFGKVDLSFAEKVPNESYHAKGSVGRPPRKPLGIFKASSTQTVEARSKRQDAREADVEGPEVKANL